MQNLDVVRTKRDPKERIRNANFTFITGQKFLKIYERLIEVKDQLISRSHNVNQNRIKGINPKSKTKLSFNFQKGFRNKEEYCYNHPTEICRNFTGNLVVAKKSSGK